jgi:hypothetical protein
MKETNREATLRFNHDPLLFLDEAFSSSSEPALWLQRRYLFLAESEASREVLANKDGLYEEHSDFFHTRRGVFGTRPVQMEMGRASRALLRTHLHMRADRLPDLVRRSLAPRGEWPDAGNWLAYRHFRDALATPDSPPRLLQALDAIVARAVLAGARERYSVLRRAVFRFWVMRELKSEIEKRRSRRADPPSDLLDVVAGAAEPGASAAELAEVYLSFLFAIAGSVGFVLGWSLYLLGTHPGTATEPAWVVREALRLWPVAWVLERRPARPHEIAGEKVAPRDAVVVCPYTIHRNPRHWEDPRSFRPERWATAIDQQAFIPFGWGPHRCVAAALSLQFVEDALRCIVDGYRLALTPHEARPHMGPALAPPRFTLALEPVPCRTDERR